VSTPAILACTERDASDIRDTDWLNISVSDVRFRKFTGGATMGRPLVSDPAGQMKGVGHRAAISWHCATSV
jgi:hypothetical protein